MSTVYYGENSFTCCIFTMKLPSFIKGQYNYIKLFQLELINYSHFNYSIRHHGCVRQTRHTGQWPEYWLTARNNSYYDKRGYYEET